MTIKGQQSCDTRNGATAAGNTGEFFCGGYNRQGTRLILAEVARGHGQEAVDHLIRELRLDGHIIQPLKLQELARWK